ncbi:major capsid protein [Streptomyces sp. NPDC047515]|uniref:major capsid protein n=1 Tax=Streptomyces sp. NPDC047515 TaxID=3155380 RepID=UPI0033D67C00
MGTTLDRLLRNVTPEDINAYISGLPVPNTYALTQSVIPERKIYGPKFRIESNKRRINAAKFRAFETPHALAKRQAERVVNEGMLPPVGQTLEMGELSLILFQARRGADDQEFIDALYDDLERHFTSIKIAMEIAAGELLSTGVVNLPGVGLDVDWNVPDENKPVAATPWDQDGATPLTDEMAWIRYLKSVGAPKPARVITSERAASVLASNLEYRTAFWNSSSPGTTPSTTLSPPDVNAVRARWNLPPIEIYDEQVWSDDQYIRTTPESLWAMVPPNPEQWAQTQYGVTAEQDNLDEGENPGIAAAREPGIYVSMETKANPPSVSTTANAIAMPVLYVPNFHISATVLSKD